MASHGSDTPTSPRAVLHHKDTILCTFMHTTVPILLVASKVLSKVRSSYGPLAYFSDIFISGKNVVISAEIFG